MSGEELREEYDFTQLHGKAQGKYAERYSEGTNLVHLVPDVASVFHGEAGFSRPEEFGDGSIICMKEGRQIRPANALPMREDGGG